VGGKKLNIKNEMIMQRVVLMNVSLVVKAARLVLKKESERL